MTDLSTRIDTTHVVTNPRVSIDGDSATLTALVEAQHLSSDDHSRHALLMRRVVVDCAWFTGDPQVIVGR